MWQTSYLATCQIWQRHTACSVVKKPPQPCGAYLPSPAVVPQCQSTVCGQNPVAPEPCSGQASILTLSAWLDVPRDVPSAAGQNPEGVQHCTKAQSESSCHALWCQKSEISRQSSLLPLFCLPFCRRHCFAGRKSPHQSSREDPATQNSTSSLILPTMQPLHSCQCKVPILNNCRERRLLRRC